MKKYQVVEHVRTSSFHHPREKKTAYSTERCLNEWWSMGTLGNWHHVTFTFELCGRRFPSGSRISWFSCYLYVAFMAQDGSRWLKIFHDIPNKYRHGASPPWTLKTPCDFYSLHRWCTSSTKEVTQESSAVNAPTRRDSESKVEYLGQVGGRHRAAPIGGWNQWNILFKWKPHSGKLHIIICLNCLGLFTRHQGFVFWMAMTCNS